MKLLLLLDYDGTLVPIKKNPKLARLSPKRKAFLRKLAACPGVKLAIISGRKLSELKKMVGIPELIYAGNHGLEIEKDLKLWTHPEAVYIPLPLKKQLKRKLRYPEILIEDKGLSLSVHYRLLPPKKVPLFKKDFMRLVKPWGRTVKITGGKKVLEIRPPVDWDKGKAVKWIINRLRPEKYFPVYIGDDKTDEDAFLALRQKGLTIHVGKGKTPAKLRLKDISGVYRYLKGLAKNES